VLRADADIVIETGELNVNQLRSRSANCRRRAGRRDDADVDRVVRYKHGIPLDVDLMFDCRFLPTRTGIESLRPLSGQDDAVREYVLGQPETQVFLDKVVDLLLSWTGVRPGG